MRVLINLIMILQVVVQGDLPLESRIWNGQLASPHQFPFHVVIFTPSGECGGSIIRDNVVLTAAHCVNSTTFAYAIVGTDDLAETLLSQLIKSRRIIVHENYTSDGSKGQQDIALVVLQRKIAIDNETIKIIPLYENDTSLINEEAFVTGFGISRDSTNNEQLLYMNSTIISNANCQSTYNNTIEDTMICLEGTNGKSPCFGDSGGPLFLERNGEHVLVGITSFGHDDGCANDHPTVFTRISKFVDWIESNLSNM